MIEAPAEESVSIREMCECIAEYTTAKTGEVWTGQSIFDTSPGGEIWPIVEAYRKIKAITAMP